MTIRARAPLLWARRFLVWPLNDLAALSIVLAAQVLLGYFLLDYAFKESGSLRVPAIILSLLPVSFAYFALSLLIAPYLSATLISGALLLFSVTNKVKLASIGDPITWSDISSLSNVSVVWTYLTWQHLLAVVALMCLVVAVGLFTRPNTAHWSQRPVKIVLSLMLLPAVFYPYAHKFNEEFARDIKVSLANFGISYSAWDWNLNLKNNGLPYHLIQTSERSLPAKATQEELAAFDNLQTVQRGAVVPPQNVIIILCESCWHDDTTFKGHFAEFEKLGFENFRGISPTYGGLTVNAEFELLVGLPTRGLHAGVIYQEYSDLISKRALTYPQSLNKAGFQTVAAHNHHRKFWRRNIVNGKLGFDRFIALGDMNYDGPTWADDKILFDVALETLEASDTNTFLFLTTVYSHGPYKFQNDFGEGVYQHRLKTTMQRATEFSRKVIADYPDSLILLLGDHKPALTRFFFENGTFPKDSFQKIGQNNSDFVFTKDQPSRAALGDVPGYIYHRDPARVSRFINNANKRPFYCITQALNREFTNIELPAFNYSQQQSICQNFTAESYNISIKLYPSWLYSKSLFESSS